MNEKIGYLCICTFYKIIPTYIVLNIVVLKVRSVRTFQFHQRTKHDDMRKKLSANISLDIDHHQDEWETGKNVCVCALKVLVHKADILLPYPDRLSIYQSYGLRSPIGHVNQYILIQNMYTYLHNIGGVYLKVSIRRNIFEFTSILLNERIYIYQT